MLVLYWWGRRTHIHMTCWNDFDMRSYDETHCCIIRGRGKCISAGVVPEHICGEVELEIFLHQWIFSHHKTETWFHFSWDVDIAIKIQQMNLSLFYLNFYTEKTASHKELRLILLSIDNSNNRCSSANSTICSSLPLNFYTESDLCQFILLTKIRDSKTRENWTHFTQLMSDSWLSNDWMFWPERMSHTLAFLSQPW